jgi:hypothetical protein
LRLSGRAGDERIRGTLHAGLAAPASIRFEAVAPFGAPIFILAGRDNRATLLFPRDNRVLPDAGVAEILEHITGLALGANDLRLILTGCLAEEARPSDGRSWSGGWRTVSLTGASGAEGAARLGITAYLRDVDGVAHVVAADYGDWRVDYSNHRNGFPRTVRIRGELVDIAATLDQLEINTAIVDKAFAVDVPGNAERLTIEHLKSVAPLKGTD